MFKKQVHYKNKVSLFLKKDVVRNFLMYSFGAVFIKGVSFILIPVYTKLIPPAEYGILELINTYSSLLTTFCALGLAQVLYIDYLQVSKEERKNLINNIISIYFTISTALYIVIIFITLLNYQSIFPNVSFHLALISIFTVYLTFFQTIFFITLRFDNRSLFLTILQISTGIIMLALNILFVVYFREGIKGILISSLISLALSLFFFYDFFKKNVGKFHILKDKEVIKKYLKLSLPFVPSALSIWLMNGANRWILLNYTDTHYVGLYSLAYKFSNMFEPLLITPFLSAYAPYIFMKFRNSEFDQKLRYLIPVICILFLSSGFIVQFAAKFFVYGEYKDALYIIPYLIFALSFWTLAQVAASFLVFRKKVMQMLLCVVIGGAVNILANFILVPLYNILGTAIASIVGYLSWFVLIYYFNKKELKLALNK